LTLNRMAATALLAQRSHLIRGATLELGVGEHPFCREGTVVSLDVEVTYGPDIQGDAHALPFVSGAFDTVIASQVFEHLHTPSAALDEVQRVLRPGGHLLLAVPFLFFLHQEPHDYQRFTSHGIGELFRDRPFAIEILAFGGRVVAAVDLLCTSTRSSSLPRRALRKARKIVSPPRPQDVTRLGRWLADRDPREFPIGYVVCAERLTNGPLHPGSPMRR